MPYAVLFDVDGTLVDSNDLHVQCWVQTLAHFGIEIEAEAVRGQMGKGSDQLLPAILPQDQVDEQGEAITQYRKDLFMRDYLERVQPFPGVKPLFERIKADGGLIVLASSGSQDEVDHHVELLGIRTLIETATTSDDAASSKPAPDIFETALTHLPDHLRAGAIVVGDTPYDAEAASKAGLRTIGFLCGGFSEADLRDAGCIATFAGPEDLLARFEQSPLRAEAGKIPDHD